MVIGVGNGLRSDDAVGLAAVGLLRDAVDPQTAALLLQEGEALGLIEQWQGAGAVILVDAMRSGVTPGTILRADASSTPLPAVLASRASTHAVGVGEVVELARLLGRLPARLIVYGVEGRNFTAGSELSDELRATLPELTAAVLREIDELRAQQRA
jgi:hydrogenase maturation protease